MAKRPTQQTSSDADIRKLLDGLHRVIQQTNATSKEQVRINRELLKTMAVLQSGFARNEEDARKLIDDVRDGLELNDDYAKKWLKKMGATEKQIEEIIDKFRDLEKVDMDLIDSAEDYLELLEKRYDVLDDTFDLTKRLLTNHDAITKAIRASKDVALKLAGPMGDVDTILQKMVAKRVDVSSMFADMGTDRVSETISAINDDISGLINNVGGSIVDLNLNFSPLTDDLDKEIADVLQSIEIEKAARLNALSEYFDVNKKLQTQLTRSLAASMSGIDVSFDVDTGQISTAAGILQRGTDEYQEMIQKLDDIAAKNNITDKLKVDFKKIIELIALGANKTEEQERALNSLISPLDLSTKMMLEQLEILDIQSSRSKSELQAAKDRYQLMGNYLNQLQTAESIVLKIGSTFDNLNAIMPTGIGEFLGLSKVSSQLIESHKKGVQSFASELERGVSHADALKSYYKEMTPALTSILNPMTILITSTILLYNFVSNIVDKYKEMSAKMKTSLLQSKQMYEVQLDILTSQKNQFATMEDITDLQSAMIEYGGKVSDLSTKSAKELSISLIEMGKAFGYGTENAVKLHKLFQAIGADDRLAETLQQNVGLLSEAAGISPQIVTEDLIDSAEEVSLYFAGMPEQAAKAAIKVRQMGMSLKQAGQIAKKMLNLDSFMTDMYELQAMTAGTVDFSKAFDKGLMGDIQGMTEDIMNNIGTVAEFDRMDYLTRMKIANTLGMSADELARSVKLHEDMQGMSEQDQKYLQANLDRMGDISAASKDEIRNRMQQLQSTDRLNVAWDKIKGTLVKALLPAVEIIADAISAISPILDGIVGIMKIFGGILKVIFPIIKGMLFPFKIIGAILEKITSVTDSFGDSLSGTSKILSGIGDVAYVVGAAIGTIFAVRNIGGFFTFITGGFGTILKSVGSIVPALTGTFGNIFQLLTGIFTKSTATATATGQSVTEQASMTVKSTSDSAKAAMADVSTASKNAISSVQATAQASTAAVSSVTGTISTEPIKSAATETIGNITAVGKQSLEQVETAATQVDATVEKVKSKTKSGFFASDTSKSVFKGIGTFGAMTFAALGTQFAMSFMRGEDAGKESVANVSDSILPTFAPALMSLGPMLFTALNQGIERFIRKQIESKLEDKFEPALKKVRKGMATLGDPATKSLDTVADRGKSAFGKMFDFIKKNATRPLDMLKNTIAPKITEAPSFDAGAVLPKSLEPNKSPEPIEPPADKPSKKISPTVPESMDAKPIREKIQTPERSVKKSFGTIGDTIKTTWESVKSSIQNVIKFGIDTVKQLATGVVDVSKIVINGVQSISTSLFSVLKSASKSLKSILTDIVDFFGQAMKTLSSGIGQTIKNVFKGIADGLASFKTSALKGAATLVILSGALWISSKAFQNFADVDWSDIGKGIVAIGGLSAMAMVLGGASGQMIVGALAIGILGASLIPVAYALGQFEDIKWESLAKAGVTLLGLGAAGVVLGSVSPMLLAGSVAIAALGLAIIPAAIAMEKFNSIEWSALGKAGVALMGFAAVATIFGTISPIIVAGSLAIGAASISIYLFSGALLSLGNSISNIDAVPLKELINPILSVTTIPVMNIFALSGAITTLGASILAFSAMKLGGGIMDAVSGFFANDLLNDLQKFASLANPLEIAAIAIGALSSGLANLSSTMMQSDFSKLNELKNVGEMSVEQEMTNRIQHRLSTAESLPSESRGTDLKVIPVPVPPPAVKLPRKEAVAQNVNIADKYTAAAHPQSQLPNSVESSDIYNRPELPLKELKFLLQDAVKYLEIIAKKNPSVSMDSYKVGKLVKAHNNT